MTSRDATVRRIDDRHVFAARIPYLPDLLAAEGAGAFGDPVREAYARQTALLRALTAFRSGQCALQLRFLAAPDAGRALDVVLLGAANDLGTALDLLQLVLHAKPPEVELKVVRDEEEVRALVDPFPGVPLDAQRFAEIRRAVQPVDPAFPEPDGDVGHIVLPWVWAPQTFTHSLGILRAQPGATALVLHVEPRRTSVEAYEHLNEAVHRFSTVSRSERSNAILEIGQQIYYQRVSTLRRGALHLRVFLASAQPLLAGTPEYLGADLSRSTDQRGILPQAFEVVRPGADDAPAAEKMLRRLTAPVWGLPAEMSAPERELLFLVDPLEANCAFRIPVTPKGGLPGLATAPAGATAGRQLRDLDLTSTDRSPRIVLGQGPSIGDFALTRDELNQHVLVAGVPGSGKSTTVRSLLLRLSADGVPFLVLDPAKSDYSVLSGVATVHRLGLESVAFNPLAAAPGVAVAGHAGRVLASFDNAFRLSENWPLGRTFLGLALREAYRTAGCGAVGTSTTSWPTLADLYTQVRAVIHDQELRGDAAANVRASLLGRIEFLIDGGLGVALAGGPRDGVDWAALMARNTVVEMRAFTSPEDRTLLFGLLFSGLVGYREAASQEEGHGEGLRHVTVLEEAHRLLASSGGNDFAARLFSDAIAELRGAGEGFVIVDQAPSTLLASAAKNTGTKIAHRLLDGAEREFVGESMVLDAQQKVDLARLGKGRVLALGSSLTEAVVVDVTPEDVPFAPPAFAHSLVEDAVVTRPWCRYCPSPCRGRRGMELVDGLLDLPLPTTREDVHVLMGTSRRLAQARWPDSRMTVTEDFCAVASTLGRRLADDPVLLPRALAHHRELLAPRPAAT